MQRNPSFKDICHLLGFARPWPYRMSEQDTGSVLREQMFVLEGPAVSLNQNKNGAAAEKPSTAKC